jgi:hypothetical protein
MRSRFIFLDGEPRVFTNRVKKIAGTHRGYRLLFDTEGVSDVLQEREWKRLLMRGRIRPMPIDLRMEELSDLIGKEYTPQKALSRALDYLRTRSKHEKHFRHAEQAEVSHV